MALNTDIQFGLRFALFGARGPDLITHAVFDLHPAVDHSTNPGCIEIGSLEQPFLRLRFTPGFKPDLSRPFVAAYQVAADNFSQNLPSLSLSPPQIKTAHFPTQYFFTRDSRPFTLTYGRGLAWIWAESRVGLVISGFTVGIVEHHRSPVTPVSQLITSPLLGVPEVFHPLGASDLEHPGVYRLAEYQGVESLPDGLTDTERTLLDTIFREYGVCSLSDSTFIQLLKGYGLKAEDIAASKSAIARLRDRGLIRIFNYGIPDEVHFQPSLELYQILVA